MNLIKILTCSVLLSCSLSCFAQDYDKDGVDSAVDNCWLTYNPDQADNDADGIGNACDCEPGTANPGGDRTPAIIISANPGTSVAPGSRVVFSSRIHNGGTSPSFQWYKNNVLVSTNSTYTDSTFADGDSVTCTLTANVTCTAGNVRSGNTVYMEIWGLSVHKTALADLITVWPNPVKDRFSVISDMNVQSISLLSLTGQPIQQWQGNEAGSYHLDGIAGGLYFVKINTANGSMVRKIVVE